jgi:protein tyrosine/serine phosphatase
VVKFVALGLMLACGCAVTTRYDHEVPNLVQVRNDVWRSGQPRTLDGWRYLEKLGIRHVIKLDFADEGDDSAAAAFGITVHEVSIEPTTKAGFVDSVENVFATPDKKQIEEIERLVEQIREARGSQGGWLIHCFNGHDRTGLVVGYIRIVVDGWDKNHAWSEMLDRGFHPELIGLDRAFHEMTNR